MFRNMLLLRSQAFMMKWCAEVLNLLKGRLRVYSTKIFSVFFTSNSLLSQEYNGNCA